MSDNLIKSFRMLVIMVQIITPIFFIASPYPKRSHFVLKSVLSCLVCFAFAFFVLNPSHKNPYISFFLNTIYFYLYFVLCNMMVFILYKVSFSQSVLIAVIAYSLQHIGYLIFNILDTIVSSFYTFHSVFSYIFLRRLLITIPLLIASYILGRRIKKNPNVLLPSSTIFAFALIGVMADIILSNAPLESSLIGPNYANIAYYAIRGFNLIVCILVLILIFFKVDQEKMEKDMVIIQQLNNEKSKLYQMNKETIDLINLKVHDLKHQIRLLSTSRKEISEDVINEINQTLNIYDTQINTGRDALNTILQEKALICKNKNITFECMIDASCLSNISDSDLYSLLGNILDNAIESSEICQNGHISLKIKKVGSMAFINESNSTINKITFKDGIPQTNKKDTNYHGFGVKSIIYIANKYDGSVKMDYDNHTFYLTVSLNNKRV